MKSKRMILIIGLIIILVLAILFTIFYYKNVKNGNNTINKSEEEIVKSILDMKAYSANLDVTIETNKNKTKYLLNQKLDNGKVYQEVLKPENIAGVITEYDGKTLTIKNNKLKIEKTFEDYKYVIGNTLWLDSFIKEYKEEKDVLKSYENSQIILEVRKKENPYNMIKKLYIDKNTGKPTKMIVQDINQKTLIYILYTEIKIS